MAFSQSLRRISAKRSPVPAVDVDVSGRQSVVSKTQELYRVPRIAVGPRPVTWAKEVVTWPRYAGGAFRLGVSGESMLELSDEEASALCIILLKIDAKQERYGSPDQFNWKKTGLSRARFKPQRVTEQSMPTARAVAAYQYLMQHNAFYKRFVDMQHDRLSKGESVYISSYDPLHQLPWRGSGHVSRIVSFVRIHRQWYAG